MKPLTAYRVTKGSLDGTEMKDDIIWLSKNRMLNSAKGAGFLMEDEWDVAGSNDFEVEESEEYCVLSWNGAETLRKTSDMPFYEYKEKWDELKQRLEKAELELLLIRNNDKCSDSEQKRLDTKLSGLRIAQEYIREI